MRGIAIAVLAALVTGHAPAASPPLPPAPSAFVTDETSFLSVAARPELERRLADFHARTGHQVLLWIGRRTGTSAIEDWAARSFAAWGVGTKGRDDGVVIFVLPDEKKLRIEVGYGLEAALPDLRAATIVREEMAPRLAAGDRDGAARAGVAAVLIALAPTAAAAPPPEAAREWFGRASWYQIALGALGLIVFLALAARHPRLALFLLHNVVTLLLHGHGDGGRGRRFSGRGGRSGGGGATGSW